MNAIGSNRRSTGRPRAGFALTWMLAIFLAACTGTQTSPSAEESAPGAAEGSDAVASPSEGTSFESMEITVAHNGPSEETAQHAAATAFSDALSEGSDGQITTQIFLGDQLGGEQDIVEALQRGDVNCASISTVLASVVPKLQVLDLPYLYDDLEHHNRVVNGPVGDLLKQEIDAQGLKALGFYGQPPRMAITTESVTSLDGFSGLKIRAPQIDAYIAAIEALGATPVVIPFPEVYTSLQTGVVEGAELDPIILLSSKLYEVAPFVAVTNHILTTQTLFCNGGWFDGLETDVQSLIESAGVGGAEAGYEYSRDNGQAAIEELETLGVTFAEMDLAAVVERVEPVYAEFGERLEAADLIDEIRATE